MTRLVLVRHGESVVTVNRVLGGARTCTGLSELGVRQVEALRDRWSRTVELGRVDTLYSSTLARARQTADIVAPVLGGLPVVEDHDLREHDPGEADGMPFEDIAARYGDVDWGKEPYKVPIPGSESVAGFHHRVAVVLQRIATEHDGETVVVACHGGVIDIAMRSLLRAPMVGAFDLWTLNTSVTEFVRTGPRWRLVRYNDAAHLEGLPAESPPVRRARGLGLLELREVGPANFAEITALEVWPHQQRFVAPVALSLAEAHHSHRSSWYRAAYAGEIPIGFVLVAEPDPAAGAPPSSGWHLWRLLVAGRYQRLGLGRRIVELVATEVERRAGAGTPLYTTWLAGEGGPEPFWLSCGFEPTGATDEPGLVVARRSPVDRG